MLSACKPLGSALGEAMVHLSVCVASSEVVSARHGALSLKEENLPMPVVPSGIVNQRQLATAIQKSADVLAPDVVRIRYALAIDSTGSAAIFFRVLLSDHASKRRRLLQVTNRVRDRIVQTLEPVEEWGLLPHFEFRNESEQAALKEKAWA